MLLLKLRIAIRKLEVNNVFKNKKKKIRRSNKIICFPKYRLCSFKKIIQNNDVILYIHQIDN